jgi:hypothetical protein
VAEAAPSPSRVESSVAATRVCQKCGIEKPATSEHFPVNERAGFNPDGTPRGFWTRCRRCSGTYRSAEAKIRNRLHRYGMTAEEFAARKARGNCPICKRAFVERNLHSQQPVVDHDHETGYVRGIICRSCNLGLGYFRDNPEMLEAAAEYVDYRTPRNVSVNAGRVA